ncbi:MAG: hypothetical protein RLZZ52_1280 [Actinomycetota bacterium]
MTQFDLDALFGSEHNFEPTAPLAQLAEQLTLNQWVPGSSPGGCTNTKTTSRQVVFLFTLQGKTFTLIVMSIEK